MILRLLLRGGGLGAKFLLVLAITHYLGYQAFGLYGLVLAASIIASKFYSVGFSSEINRLISVGESTLFVIDRVLILYLTVGLFLSVVTAGLYSLTFGVDVGVSLIVCATLLLLTEHISFEINSFVFSAQKADLGALLFFIKTGLWALIAVGGLMMGWVSTITSVLWLWLIANIAVIAAGYFIIANIHRDKLASSITTISVWRAGLPFYFGVGLIALSEYAERFLILGIEPYDNLGRYVYTWSIANTLQALSYAVVAVVGIPALAKHYQNNAQRLTMGKLFLNEWVFRSLVLSCVVSVSIYGFFFIAIDFFSETIPRPDNKILCVLVFSFILRAIGDIVWGGLIASQNSRISLVSAAVCLLVSMPISYVLIKHYSIYGAAWGNVFSIMVQLAVIALLTKLSQARGAL